MAVLDVGEGAFSFSSFFFSLLLKPKMIVMEELVLKFNRLDSFSQKLVLDFIEMLIKRQKEKPTTNIVSDSIATEYKKQPKSQNPPASEPVEMPPPVSWELAQDRQLYQENKQYLDSLRPELRPLVLGHLRKLRATQTPEEAKDDPFGNKAWKKKLLEMPPWSDEEIKEFDEAIASIKNWKIEEW